MTKIGLPPLSRVTKKIKSTRDGGSYFIRNCSLKILTEFNYFSFIANKFATLIAAGFGDQVYLSRSAWLYLRTSWKDGLSNNLSGNFAGNSIDSANPV